MYRQQCPFCIYEGIEPALVRNNHTSERNLMKHVAQIHFTDDVRCQLCFIEKVKMFYHDYVNNDYPDRLGCQCCLCLNTITRWHNCTGEYITVNKFLEDERHTESILGSIFKMCC